MKAVKKDILNIPAYYEEVREAVESLNSKAPRKYYAFALQHMEALMSEGIDTIDLRETNNDFQKKIKPNLDLYFQIAQSFEKQEAPRRNVALAKQKILTSQTQNPSRDDLYAEIDKMIRQVDKDLDRNSSTTESKTDDNSQKTTEQPTDSNTTPVEQAENARPAKTERSTSVEQPAKVDHTGNQDKPTVPENSSSTYHKLAQLLTPMGAMVSHYIHQNQLNQLEARYGPLSEIIQNYLERNDVSEKDKERVRQLAHELNIAEQDEAEPVEEEEEDLGSIGGSATGRNEQVVRAKYVPDEELDEQSAEQTQNKRSPQIRQTSLSDRVRDVINSTRDATRTALTTGNVPSMPVQPTAPNLSGYAQKNMGDWLGPLIKKSVEERYGKIKNWRLKKTAAQAIEKNGTIDVLLKNASNENVDDSDKRPDSLLAEVKGAIDDAVTDEAESDKQDDNLHADILNEWLSAINEIIYNTGANTTNFEKALNNLAQLAEADTDLDKYGLVNEVLQEIKDARNRPNFRSTDERMATDPIPYEDNESANKPKESDSLTERLAAVTPDETREGDACKDPDAILTLEEKIAAIHEAADERIARQKTPTYTTNIYETLAAQADEDAQEDAELEKASEYTTPTKPHRDTRRRTGTKIGVIASLVIMGGIIGYPTHQHYLKSGTLSTVSTSTITKHWKEAGRIVYRKLKSRDQHTVERQKRIAERERRGKDPSRLISDKRTASQTEVGERTDAPQETELDNS